ncbi:MAG: hypothetical protein H6825_00375 [Planctomycetes bacterium]|nr:hypothetical protein [Planctomycetota bacterium]
MTSNKRLWTALVLCVAGAFTILGFFGHEVYRQAPPLPERVVTASGELLATRDSILDGQQAWQSLGGQQLGSIWGHGAYQAPDWSADWLHREAMALLDTWALAEHGMQWVDLDAEDQAGLQGRLRAELRTNRYDADSGTLVISDARAAAVAEVGAHYRALFGGDESLASLRESYALQDDAITDPARLDALMDFFF